MPNQDPYLAQELLSHQTFLRRLAIDLVGKDADDLVQDVWQRALERPPHHGRQLRGWLTRVARNLAANRWRGEARRTELEERRASERPAGEELEARFELRKELVEALDSLSQPCRETILLRYFEGLAPRDIASRRGTPVATVKTRLRRGLAQLREALDERHGGDRATWTSAVTALAVPAGGGVETGTLVIGGMVVGTMMKASAAVLVAAACVYFVTRTPRAESPPVAAVEPRAAGGELVDAADVFAAADPTAVPASVPTTGAARRSPVADEPPAPVDDEVHHVLWPEITLAVRDARTRAHLKDVDIRCAPSSLMGLWRRPGNEKHYTPIGKGLRSPVALLGGHEADDPETRVAGLAVSPAAGEAPQLVELMRGGRVLPEGGVLVYARAPGYAWGRIGVDVSSGDEYELLLEPDATLSVQLANVQLERYAAIEVEAEIDVHRLYPNGNRGYVWFQDIDETLVAEGLRLDGLKPGDYSVEVKLGDRWSRSKRPVLAREEVTLAVAEPRELVLRLDDPPERKRRSATLAGSVSFPNVQGDPRWVRLDLFEVKNAPVSMLSLADMERTDDTPPTWSFRVEDLPEGRYQFLLRPFMARWMVELPPEGREDLELVIPEFAEVLVETVDARTGERVPLDSITFGLRDLLPGQIQTHQQTGVRFEGEPGRFRFWTTPGAAFVQTHEMPSGHDYGWRRKDLELVPGPQSVRLELGPRHAIRFEYRENGEAAPRGDDIYWGSIPRVRAVDHGGHVTNEGFSGNRIMEVSAPGVYEVSFEDVTAHSFQSIPPRRVTVREGETAEVIVELRWR